LQKQELRKTEYEYKGNQVFYNSDKQKYYVERECKFCSKKYLADRSKLKQDNGKGNFCSKSCASKNRKGEFAKIESYNGKEVFRGEDSKARIIRECDVCGKEYEARVDSLKRDKGKTCGRSCGSFQASQNRDRDMSEYPRGEDHGHYVEEYNPYYGKTWIEARSKALERDNFECAVCGKDKSDLPRRPDVHHIIPARFFEDENNANFLENLITLCPEHHNMVEGWFGFESIFLQEDFYSS
jgi:5-methylcytosine-specific restriction endonuclease McrA